MHDITIAFDESVKSPNPPIQRCVADIISKLNFRYMAWMRCPEWPLFYVFVDHMSGLMCKFSLSSYWGNEHKRGALRTSDGVFIGSNNEPNGPNKADKK